MKARFKELKAYMQSFQYDFLVELMQDAYNEGIDCEEDNEERAIDLALELDFYTITDIFDVFDIDTLLGTKDAEVLIEELRIRLSTKSQERVFAKRKELIKRLSSDMTMEEFEGIVEEYSKN